MALGSCDPSHLVNCQRCGRANRLPGICLPDPLDSAMIEKMVWTTRRAATTKKITIAIVFRCFPRLMVFWVEPVLAWIAPVILSETAATRARRMRTRFPVIRDMGDLPTVPLISSL